MAMASPAHKQHSINGKGEANLENAILESLTLGYTQLNSTDLLEKTIEYLKENIRPGICLICIENVEQDEAIWSCDKCYCILHLVCIQRWARDSISNLKEAAAQKGFNIPIVWCCPKCRGENSESQFPGKYKCFCGKVENPKSSGWSAPHTCGEICGKALQPECGHSCVLLCHAGACPPCPKQVIVSCHCGKSATKPLRCYAKEWSCGSKCDKLLICGEHHCQRPCHSGDCAPCSVPVLKKCKCSSPQTITIICSELGDDSELSCGAICGKLLDCGVHKCEKVCHSFNCESCYQSCPCGKSKMACIGQKERVSGKPCSSTCGRDLDCGQHKCEQKCHTGSCGSCLELVTKKCRCGARAEEVSCSKDYACTMKCKKIRDCGVHPCNKKCCPGDCPPCRNTCGKTLNCKNHKCEMICHRGPCYPCPVAAAVKCFCGQSVRYVPCGSEKKCQPPECENECAKPSKCDHPRIQKHKCHYGDCPRCTVICGKSLSCGHTCPNVCHSFKGNPKPCFKCVKKVSSTCYTHPNVLVPCHKQTEACEEICGRSLSCGAHVCSKRCHWKVIDSCGICNDSCSKPRPEGCTHSCSMGCHEGRCQDCTLIAKISCHCGSETLLVPCYKQHSLPEVDKSCKNQCPKKLTCGHRCLSLCHSGECSETEKCRRKVKVTCKCKGFKQELECFLLEGAKFLECSLSTCMVNSGKPQSTSKNKKRSKQVKRASESHASDTALESDAVIEDTGKVEQAPDSKSVSYFPVVVIAIVVAMVGFTVVILQKG